MLPGQRLAFNELLTHLRSGRVTRRTFLERSLALGFSSMAALSLLESCGGSSGNPINLLWQADYDPSSACPQLVETFNQRYQGRIHVTLQLGPNGTNDLITIEHDILNAHSAAVDIFSIDIIYMAWFAQQRWLQPISENRWPLKERANYLEVPLKACTFDEQVWAVPFRSDIGLIYYRTDFNFPPPTTWEELTSNAREARAQKRDSHFFGYAWQGAQYEGSVCNFDEVLHGYGGSLFADPLHPTVVTIDSPEARQALTTMVNWIGTISPPNTDTYTEEVTRNLWANGGALYMRNWLYAYNTQSRALGHNFAIHPMLPGGNHHTGHSSLGGWQLGINAFSDPAKQEAAWEFVHYMISPEAQKVGATVGSWVMTLQSIYEDQEVLRKVPFYKALKPILQAAVPRPVAPNYIDISTAIQASLRRALEGLVPVPEVLKGLASTLTRLTNK